MGLRINPVYSVLLPALSSEEFSALRDSLKSEGCRDPLVVWSGAPSRENYCKQCYQTVEPKVGDGIWECPKCGFGIDTMEDVIIDGHNRYQICEEEKIPYETIGMEFDNEEDAADWIDKNQIARRNLSPDDFRLAVGRRYNRTKKAQGGDHKSKCQNDTLIDTAEKLASEHGVSPATVKRAGKLAEAFDQVQSEEPEIAAQGREAVIERAKDMVRPHVVNNSGDNEWYTPKPYIEAARAVLKKIEIDPASSEVANSVVRAERIFTSKDDGLKQDWAGNLWLNPPYSSSLIGQFVNKLAESVQSGSVEEAIVLVNNATDTKWFAQLVQIADYFCFPTGRIKFWKINSDKAAPLQGQAVAYIGRNGSRFCSEFMQFGSLMKVVK